jgi:hypothetical protein
LSAALAENSFVVEISSWCKGATYNRTRKVGGLDVPVFKCQDGSMGRPNSSPTSYLPGKWGLVIVVPGNAGAAGTILEARNTGLRNLAIFENREGAEAVAQFADDASATAQLKTLPAALAKNSFVVEIRSWCKAAKYAGTETTKSMANSTPENKVPIFKCQDGSMGRVPGKASNSIKKIDHFIVDKLALYSLYYALIPTGAAPAEERPGNKSLADGETRNGLQPCGLWPTVWVPVTAASDDLKCGKLRFCSVYRRLDRGPWCVKSC